MTDLCKPCSPNQPQDAAGEGRKKETPAPQTAHPKKGEKPELKSPFVSRGTEKKGKVEAQPPPSASVISQRIQYGRAKPCAAWRWEHTFLRRGGTEPTVRLCKCWRGRGEG